MRSHFFGLSSGLIVLFFLSGCGAGGSSPTTTPPSHHHPHSTHTNTMGGGTAPVTPAATVVPASGDASFKTDHFVGSGGCATCHNGLRDHGNQDVSLETDWNSTMMANAARDPLFRAKLAAEIKRFPALKDKIEEKCARCHTPMASFEMRMLNQKSNLTGDGFFNQTNKYFSAAMDGVSCSLCHQVSADKLGAPAGFSGNYELNHTDTIYGPFENPTTGPMRTAVGFTPAYAPHITESKLCSTCHNLFNDVIDASGKATGQSFGEQTLYTEWENSQYAQGTTARSCQYCHMPETLGVTVATGTANLPMRNAFSRHLFVGGNTLMLDILNNNKTALAVKANNFPVVIARTRELLKQAASLEMVMANNTSAVLEFALRVRNTSGHKLPSGYLARRAYLHVTVKNAAGAVVFESGATNADGSIVGVDADANALAFERHYDVISSSNDVQVYEAITGDTTGQANYSMMRAATYLKDNRLLPAGSQASSLPAEIRPDATTLADSNFSGGSDEVTYRLAGLGVGPFTVEAELNYQTASYRYLQDLYTYSTEAPVSAFKGYFQASSVRNENIASLTSTVP